MANGTGGKRISWRIPISFCKKSDKSDYLLDSSVDRFVIESNLRFSEAAICPLGREAETLGRCSEIHFVYFAEVEPEPIRQRQKQQTNKLEVRTSNA